MKINLPETGQKRIVIVGGGFAGLTLARKLSRLDYQVVLLDQNNYHQFQPLFYQVAMAGLEPSSIVFPLRKLFHRRKNVFIRVTEVLAVETEQKRLQTTLGVCNYDYLVLAIGARTNFFGNEKVARRATPMKSVSEALYLRNRILNDYETALSTTSFEDRQGYLDIVIVGGGPTGVEVAGALAEMRKYVFPKDYPELNADEIDIYLVQGGPVLLQGMSENASQNAKKFLEELDVKVLLNALVVDFDGEYVYLKDGRKLQARKVIWAAGITGNRVEGLPETVIARGNRLVVNRRCQIQGFDDLFAIGDIAYMEEDAFPDGHPQVAQVALQQARYLGRYFRALSRGQAYDRPFRYQDKGSMATIGRNRAVVDLPGSRFSGAFAWLIWMFVHLFALLGAKNKLFVFINWVWNYLTYDQSLRLIIRPHRPQAEQPEVAGESKP